MLNDLRGQLPKHREYDFRDPNAIEGVTLHYTAGPAHQTARAIAEFQTSPAAAAQTGAGEPFPAIAYTILVTGDGTPNLCHDLDRRTWHSSGIVDGRARNATHIGVCYTGDVAPNAAQVIGLATAIRFCQEELGRPLSIEGHRNAVSTTCPGPRWPGWLDDVLNGMQRQPTLDELEQANPNIRSQLAEWQAARQQLGQDPFHWPDFRAFQVAIHAPDPGPLAAVGFGGSPNGESGVPGQPTIEQLEQHNPNIRGQLELWQAARRALAENPFDWPEFRVHVGALGAPDPGPRPPVGFGS